MTAIPSRFTVPMKACGCGVLLGEECDCTGIPPKSITPTYPQGQLTVWTNGVPRRIERPLATTPADLGLLATDSTARIEISA
jgi:hypothetical protein